tara:strand:+ start:1833 stop:2348 length:516 start_codon:yes stop_codon:yes gene_type:complete
MSALLDFDASKIKDISREHKVRRKIDAKECTHTITLVPPTFLNSIWPDVREQLARAVYRSYGRWNLEFLYASIQNGKQQLWLAFDEDNNINGVGTTEIVQYPQKKMLAVQFLGGDKFNEWVWSMLERLKDWGRDNQCSGIEATARMGFWKWLEQDDFTRSFVVYERSLEDE